MFGRTGRRWKSAAAAALSISRPTLYRYLDLPEEALPSAVPKEVVDRIAELSRQTSTLPPLRDLAISYARGLNQLQENIDRNGYISAPYPSELLRALSIASAYNLKRPALRYPDNLAALLERAPEPLHEWFSDLDWDSAGDYTTAQFIRHGVITAECLLLASTPADIEEREGYDALLNHCRRLGDGQEFYVAWRKLMIERPVMGSLAEVINTSRIFQRHIEVVTELAGHFLEPVPRQVGDEGMIALCPTTGTRATRFDGEWVCESRDPDVQSLLKAQGPRYIVWTPDARQVKRIFRQFWVLPGYYELDLYRRAIEGGWQASLWPKFDSVDLVLRKDGQAIALDLKDHINSIVLAQRFTGFRGFEKDHDCFVVVPDYVTRIDTRYRKRFDAVRRAHGKLPVQVKAYSELLNLIGGDE